MNPLDLIPAPWNLVAKIVLPILILAGAFGFGYYKGYENESNANKAAVVDHVVAQTKALPAETKVLTETVTKIETVHDKVYVDVPKLIRDDRACDVPAAAVGMLNANRGTLPAAN